MKNSKLKNYAKTIISIQNLLTSNPTYVIGKAKLEASQTLSVTFRLTQNFFNTYDWAVQLMSMLNYDITKIYNGLITKLAYAPKITLFIRGSSTGLIINPKPVLEFAKIINAGPYIFENNCGHVFPGCELENFSIIKNSLIFKSTLSVLKSLIF